MGNSFIRTASSEKHDSKFLVMTCSLMQSTKIKMLLNALCSPSWPQVNFLFEGNVIWTQKRI